MTILIFSYPTTLHSCKIGYRVRTRYASEYNNNILLLHNKLLALAEQTFAEKGIIIGDYDKIVASMPGVQTFEVYEKRREK